LRSVDAQGELPLRRNAPTSPVSPEVVRAQPSFRAAIRLAANASGLEEKEIYVSLKIDAGHWTRMMNGDANFPDDKLEQFMDIVENDIPLEWLAFRRGKGLVMLEGEAERQLRLEQEKNERLASENKLLRDLVQGKAA
jgi:hypothetical protein